MVIVALVVAIIVAGNERAKTESKNKELEKQIQKLRQDNEKLKTEVKSETRQVEPKLQEPVSLGTTTRVISVSGGEIESYILAKFGSSGSTMLAVCTSESGLREAPPPSPTGDYGACQINLSAHWASIPGNTKEEKVASLNNYRINVDLAFVISNGGTNFNPWTDYRSGKYKQYL